MERVAVDRCGAAIEHEFARVARQQVFHGVVSESADHIGRRLSDLVDRAADVIHLVEERPG